MIYWSGDRDVFQKDVEEAFHITRSSVTSAVQLMEKKGYITRRSVPCDARLKKLALTDRGIAAHKQAVQAMSIYTNDVDTLRQMISQALPQLFSSLITIAGVLFSMTSGPWWQTGQT